MIEAKGVVTRAEAGRAWVRVSERATGCGRCDEPGGCRGADLAYAGKVPRAVFRVPNPIGAAAGDEVRLRIDDGAPLRGALLGYGVGTLLLVGGAGAGTAFAGSGETDVFALVGAVVGLLASVALNRRLLRSARWRGRLAVELVRESDACSHRAVTTS